MKVWKLVSGVLCIVMSFFVLFQSCAAGLSNAMQENGEVGGSAGLIVAIMLLSGGIVSIATRNGSKGGNIVIQFENRHRERLQELPQKKHSFVCSF